MLSDTDTTFLMNCPAVCVAAGAACVAVSIVPPGLFEPFQAGAEPANHTFIFSLSVQGMQKIYTICLGKKLEFLLPSLSLKMVIAICGP